MTAALLRVRPALAHSEGPSFDKLNALTRAILNTRSDPKTIAPFTIPNTASPLSEDLIELLVDRLRGCLEHHDTIVIDFAYPRIAGLYARAEWLLASALFRFLRSFPIAKVYVVTETLPIPSERLNDLVTSDEREDIEIVDLKARWLGPSSTNESLLQRLTDVIETNESVREGFAKRFIRWRGVFSRAGVPHERFFKYQYTLKGVVAHAELSTILTNYLAQIGCDAVIFSDPADPGWLQYSVAEASLNLGIPYAALNDISQDEGLLDPATRAQVAGLRAVATAHGALCVILPAYREGLSLQEVEDVLGGLGYDETSAVLSVLMDEETLAHGVEVTNELSWVRTVQTRSSVLVDFFIAAPIETLDRGSWQVRVGRALGEISNMTMDIEGASTVAVWSLLDAYQVGVEKPTPVGRQPYGWYPQLLSMSDWDARWVVYLAVRSACARLKCEPAQIVLVMPHEENATEPMERAARDLERLSVVSLTRDQILGKVALESESESLIRESSRIVVLDEAIAQGKTQHRIDELVARIRGRGCDARVALLQVGSDTACDYSLFSWSPVAYEGSD